MDEMMKIGVSKLGQIHGPNEDYKEAVEHYAKEAGVEWIDDEQTPWCSVFLNWCTKKVNLKGSAKIHIESWLLSGWPTFSPEPGDVVVFGKGYSGQGKEHVGIFMGFSKDGKRVYCIGGNEGFQVSISAGLSENVLGYQRLVYKKEPELPESNLKKGDVGVKVKELQNALKMTGFECGTTDGDYGEKTEAAVRALKITSRTAEVNGIYDKGARDYLMIC